MMSPETLSPHWEWYYIAMYFFIGGVSAGAYFIGSLVELLGKESHREISRIAYLIAFPLICITPVLLIGDLGRPLRFWHLFFYTKDVIPYMNTTSPLSVGTWALLVYSGMSFLSFLNVLATDGRIKSEPLRNFHRLFNRIPHRVYAVIGSFFGFFVAGYTGVLLNTTARPLWVATDPFIGPLFIVSGASTGVAAIVLVMIWRKIGSGVALGDLEVFDRLAMVVELLLIMAMVIVAGKFAAPLLTGRYALMLWGGTVVLGILVPLGLNWYASRPGKAAGDVAMLTAVLVLFGGALLRVCLVQAGQM
jgi:formate-dependent nitrite reductase membrane component NrfD